MSNITNIGLYVGRFQPLHIGHLNIIKDSIKNEDKTIVIIGSIGSIDTIKNPFTFEERKNFIISCLTVEEKDKVIIVGLRDSMPEDRAIDKYWWYNQVRNIINEKFKNLINLYLYGSKKDEATGEYLGLLKNKCGIKDTKEIEPVMITDLEDKQLIINATDIRNIIRKTKDKRTISENKYLDSVIPLSIRDLF